MDLAKTISNNYMFKGVGEAEVQAIADLAQVKEFQGGDQLVRQFDKSSDILIILEGQGITKTFSGEIVSRFGPGSVIGEVALIDGQPRSANVVSVGTSKVAIIPAAAVHKMMESDAKVGYLIVSNIAKVLCMRLRAMNDHADSLTPSRSDFARA